MTARCSVWEPISGADTPCADISYRWEKGTLTVLMLFSNVRDGLGRDLSIQFPGPVLMHWEDERISRDDFGLRPLPKFSAGRWSGWTRPLLLISESPWLESLDRYNPVAIRGRRHFMLVAMNDVVHVLAQPDVVAQWQEPHEV